MEVYKAVIVFQRKRKRVALAVLETVPEVTQFLFTGDKCRASKLMVRHFEDRRGNILPNKVAFGRWAHGFKYRVGKMVVPTKPFHRGNYICKSGIHFFLTKRRVRAWVKKSAGQNQWAFKAGLV